VPALRQYVAQAIEYAQNAAQSPTLSLADEISTPFRHGQPLVQTFLNGFNQWTLNGEAFSMETRKPIYTVHEGRRYRLKFRNASDDIHPLHLHRHSFELTRIAGKATAGVIKDVVMLGGFQELEFDFVADNPGLTLLHCHQQLHMDFGFMALFQYA
jgi:FtsP/CotA-like multicopper oxidase with cupredoxin domain